MCFLGDMHGGLGKDMDEGHRNKKSGGGTRCYQDCGHVEGLGRTACVLLNLGRFACISGNVMINMDHHECKLCTDGECERLDRGGRTTIEKGCDRESGQRPNVTNHSRPRTTHQQGTDVVLGHSGMMAGGRHLGFNEHFCHVKLEEPQDLVLALIEGSSIQFTCICALWVNYEPNNRPLDKPTHDSELTLTEEPKFVSNLNLARRRRAAHDLRAAKVLTKAGGPQAVCPRTRGAGPMTLWGLPAGVSDDEKWYDRKRRRFASFEDPAKSAELRDVDMMRML